ncbi:MAG: PmoA family protein [Candidatus Omnitrophica bacterium]|nr:PmoA family protein [Candidatus Omnitrophota bacterium]
MILCLIALHALASCKRWQTLRAEIQPDGVAIYVEDALFTFYRTTPDWKYPYFYPVNGPLSGKSLTTESSEPYPHHHSLFFGCDKVNGGNYWQEGLNRGQIVSKKLSLLMDRGKKIVIENECLWGRPEAESPFRDHRLITVTAPGKHLRLIEFQITLTALMDVRIENTNHSLFSARMTPELSVLQGGALVNAEGLRGEKETWGKASAWCDYSGERDGVVEGLAILSHPSNRWFPEPWFTRDYGFFSPTPMNWLEGGVLPIAQGETIDLRYLTAAHAGDAKEGRIEDVFKRWKKSN